MVRLLLVIFIAFSSLSASAQMFNPTLWGFDKESISSDEYLLKFKVVIEKGWYVYSQHVGSDEDGIGPIPTSFTFDENPDVEFIDKVNEVSEHTKSGLDPIWGFEVKKFSEEVTFIQKVKIKADTKLTGYLEFMVCNDVRCLAPTTVDYSFDLVKSSGGVKINDRSGDASEKSGDATETSEVESQKNNDAPTSEKSNEEENNTIEQNDIINNSQGFNTIPGLSGNSNEPPMQWQIVTEKKADDTLLISFTATIKDGYYTYGQEEYKDDKGEEIIPRTRILFETIDSIHVLGLAEEFGSHVKEKTDALSGIKFTAYEHDVTFNQLVLVKESSKILSGWIDIYLCTESFCVPANVDFEVDLINNTVTIDEIAPGIVGTNMSEDCYGKWGCPDECGVTQEKKDKGLVTIFILGFLGGLIALITPCVFPMIPLTVSFFTKGGTDKKKGLYKAFMYGFFIVFIYFLMSVPFLIFNIAPDVLHEMSTGVLLNFIFFAIILFFAFSLLGFYEIELPNSLANKADSASDVGGVIGTFFMALTLAIVSFSCTGPILGYLLVGTLTSEGGQIALMVGMVGFGIALAFPFTLFAAFPQFLKSLPQSGGWLNSVKVVLGFAEIALALKFLSNADMADHWGFLKIEVFLGIWIICGLGIAAYLLGFIKFPHDSKIQKIGPSRGILALITIGFVVYLGSGLIYNEDSKGFKNLNLLSGLAPPAGYSFIYPKDCPQNLDCFKDYEEGMAYARKQNKPVIIDFTGYTCVNCRKMEQNVWPEDEVLDYLREDYVLISLYVDDKKTLPDSEQYISKFTGKKIRSVGNKWSDFQISNFKANSQPWYVLVSPDEKILTSPVGYMPDVDDYSAFLECGLNQYNKKTIAKY